MLKVGSSDALGIPHLVEVHDLSTGALPELLNKAGPNHRSKGEGTDLDNELLA